MELLVERRGTTHLPDAAKAQQVTDQWDIPWYLEKKCSAEWTTNAKEIYRTTRDTEVNPGPTSEDQGNSGEKENPWPEHFSLEQAAREEILEFQGEYEVELLTNHMLEDKVHMLESEVASRNQVIGDIEVKFTDYLRDYYQKVNSEVESLNGILSKSTTEVREYQAELMVAAQKDEGSIGRIEELERRKNLAENVAQRTYDKGLIMREEYQDQVQSLLRNTEDRVRQMENNSEYAQSVAHRLHTEGTEMQLNMQQSIANFKQQSDVTTSANASLQIMNRRAYNELHESNSEIESLRQHLEVAYQENRFSEENVRKVVRECMMKVSEANQQRLESDHKLRVLTNETSLRREREIESQRPQGSRCRGDGGKIHLRWCLSSSMIEQLENELKIQQITNGGLVDEANEYVKEIVTRKDEVNSIITIGFGIFRGRPWKTQVRDHSREEISFGGTEREGQEDMATPKGPGRREVVTEWERWGNISTKSSPTDDAVWIWN